MESSSFTGESSSQTDRPNNKDIDSLITPDLPQVPLQAQPPGSPLKILPSPSGLPQVSKQAKTKVPDGSTSPGLNFNIPTTSLSPRSSFNIPTTNFPAFNPAPPTSVSKPNSFSPSFSSPSTARKTQSVPTNTDGPGSLLPNLPDPLDRGQNTPVPSVPSAKPVPSPVVKPAPVVPETTAGSPPAPSYAPASDALKVPPEELSEPSPLTPSDPTSADSPSTENNSAGSQATPQTQQN